MTAPGKTHNTAAVIIPPQEAWAPIQRIRARYDKKIERWMPHITLAYPFRPREEFGALVSALEEHCREMPPFDLTFERIFYFDHGYEKYTLWLDPEPRQPLMRLQAILTRVAPDCTDAERYEFGFTPHLSIGQVTGQGRMERLRADLQAGWEPLTFAVREISLIWRPDPPGDVFQVLTRATLAS